MFDIGAQELLVIAVVAILFVRPKDLPGMLRTIGQYVAKLRAMAREFQHQFEEAARDTGVDDIRKGISSVQDLSPASKVKEAFNSIGDEMGDVKSEIAESLAGTGTETETSPAEPAETPPAEKKSSRAKQSTAKKKAGEADQTGTRSQAATDG